MTWNTRELTGREGRLERESKSRGPGRRHLILQAKKGEEQLCPPHPSVAVVVALPVEQCDSLPLGEATCSEVHLLYS